MAVRLSMVPIFVSDQGRTLEFWREKAGFDVVMNDPYQGYGADDQVLHWITVAPESPGPMLILYQPDMHPKRADELRSRVGQWTGIVFESDDVQQTYEEWSARGVEFEGPPHEQPWGGLETWFSDPDGNRFHLGSSL